MRWTSREEQSSIASCSDGRRHCEITNGVDQNIICIIDFEMIFGAIARRFSSNTKRCCIKSQLYCTVNRGHFDLPLTFKIERICLGPSGSLKITIGTEQIVISADYIYRLGAGGLYNFNSFVYWEKNTRMLVWLKSESNITLTFI